MSNINIRILSEPISYQELSRITGWRISGIYKIENLINHKVYIGKSMDIIFRLRFGHNLKYETNIHLLRAFKKYGLDNFSFEVIKLTYDLDYWETFLIQIYNATDERYGYNILPGGEGGDPEVSRRLWKDPLIREKFSNSIKTYWNSLEGQEQKRINSENQKGRCNTKNKHWFNNGEINVVDYECPEGFVPGRIGNFSQSEETRQKKSDWYKNLSEEEKITHNKKASDARRGKPKSDTCKENISKANRGRKYYNNGVIEVMRFEQPDGFVPGRLPSIKEKISKGTKKALSSSK